MTSRVRLPLVNPMSESVEALVRQAYEGAWNQGDLETLLRLAHPAIIFKTSGAFPDLEREYRGHEEMRRYWETVRAPFERLHIEVERVSQRGDDILILFSFHALGRDGVKLDARFGQVARMRGGLVASIVAYPDWSSAAAAVGASLEGLG